MRQHLNCVESKIADKLTILVPSMYSLTGTLVEGNLYPCTERSLVMSERGMLDHQLNQNGSTRSSTTMLKENKMIK